MTTSCCANCIYSSCPPHMKFSGFLTGFGVRPLCANHPDTPGQLRPVLPGGRCRNHRPKPETPAGDIRRIPLGANQYALVDAADFEWLNKYHWRLVNGYPARREKGKTIFMHREIMQAPRQGRGPQGRH